MYERHSMHIFRHMLFECEESKQQTGNGFDGIIKTEEKFKKGKLLFTEKRCHIATVKF